MSRMMPLPRAKTWSADNQACNAVYAICMSEARKGTAATAAKPTDKPTGEKSAFESFKDFFAKQHRFGRSPFAGMPTSWM